MKMKRTYEALVGMMLMFVVMMASIGVTYVRCAHTGNVSMFMADGMSGSLCQEDNHDSGVVVKANCMQVSVMKLITQFQLPQTTLHFGCQTLAAVPYTLLLLFVPVMALARVLIPQTASGYYGPPRSYLRRLGVLII